MTVLDRKLLFLGHNLPYPLDEGVRIRSYHTVRMLSQAFEVWGLYFYRLGALPTTRARARALEEMERLGRAEAFPIPQERSRARFVWDHLRSVLGGEPYTRWAYDSSDARRLLRSWLAEEEFDLVHVDSLDVMAYLPDLSGPPVVLAHHNVESELLARRAETEGAFRGAYIRHQAELVRRAEQKWCERMALNVVVSEKDAQTLSTRAPKAETLVIPNGVDTGEFQPAPSEPTGGVVFVGGYSWFPNADGMEFFATEVLPAIREALPDVTVRWVGKAPPEAVRKFAEVGVELVGYVDDIKPYVHDARCVIVPLRVGGGTRLKILDSWALGKAVVSTSIGCEGLDARRGENILIADQPTEFAAQVVRVLRDDSLRCKLEKGGRATAVSTYDWSVLAPVMNERYQSLLTDDG